jgi:hypothetical protein
MKSRRRRSVKVRKLKEILSELPDSYEVFLAPTSVSCSGLRRAETVEREYVEPERYMYGSRGVKKGIVLYPHNPKRRRK